MMSQNEQENQNEYMWEAKWEYKSFHCFLSFTEYRVNNGKGSSSIEVSEFLNLLGQEGWELASTMQKVVDYEQMVGGSGHPVGVKAHKNTGYEIIMKRKLVKVSSKTENQLDIFSLLNSTSATDTKIEEAILNTSVRLEEATDDMSIEDLTEVSKELEPDEAVAEEPMTPLLENTFYSSDSPSGS